MRHLAGTHGRSPTQPWRGLSGARWVCVGVTVLTTGSSGLRDGAPGPSAGSLRPPGTSHPTWETQHVRRCSTAESLPHSDAQGALKGQSRCPGEHGRQSPPPGSPASARPGSGEPPGGVLPRAEGPREVRCAPKLRSGRSQRRLRGVSRWETGVAMEREREGREAHLSALPPGGGMGAGPGPAKGRPSQKQEPGRDRTIQTGQSALVPTRSVRSVTQRTGGC